MPPNVFDEPTQPNSPLSYLGNNKVFSEENIAKNKPLQNFEFNDGEQYHSERRKQMLKKYPQIEKLAVTEWRTLPITFVLVLFQVTLSILLRDYYDQWWFYVICYVIGATVTHALFLAIHEITHFLCMKSAKANYLLAMIANFPIIFPYAASFKEYHLDHHVKLGVDGVDVDIPTHAEAMLFCNVLGKAVFLFFQIFFYALRPVIVRPKPLNQWHFLNIATQLTFDVILFYNFGIGPFIYFLASAFLAGGYHPCAGHFIAEHYTFVPGYETYSYYGILNWLCFNVGYHNEHHDFPNIPWSNLPKVREIAPEFYKDLPYHTSWVLVLWRFVTDPNISLYNRIKKGDKKKQ